MKTEELDLVRSMERGKDAAIEGVTDELAEVKAKLADRDEQVRNMLPFFEGCCQHMVSLGDYCPRCGV